jgi:hypothetical protein
MASSLPLPNTIGSPSSLTPSLGNRNSEYQNNTSRTHGGATALTQVLKHITLHQTQKTMELFTQLSSSTITCVGQKSGGIKQKEFGTSIILQVQTEASTFKYQRQEWESIGILKKTLHHILIHQEPLLHPTQEIANPRLLTSYHLIQKKKNNWHN